MNEDPRCCGSGTCIIDAEGRCWCGQRWDGRTMRHPPLAGADAAAADGPPLRPPPPAGQTASAA